MSEYEHSRIVHAAPDRVMDFVSDLNNLPKYLPTLRQATPQGRDRVHVRGEAAGHPYEADGYFRVDRAQRRMEWGSDGEMRYAGRMEIQEAPQGAQVTVHLSFDPPAGMAREMDRVGGDHDRAIREGLEQALQAVSREVEQGGQAV